MKNKKNNMVQFLISFCIITLIVLICVVKFLDNKKSKQELSNNQIELDTQKENIENLKATEKAIIEEKLSGMEERERMEYYFSKFISAIESKKYETAYEMLYDEFKQEYFPEFLNFEEYAKKTFPKTMSVEHSNFERVGDVYILAVTINDLVLGNAVSGKEMKFVIQESKIDEFVMSFSVI